MGAAKEYICKATKPTKDFHVNILNFSTKEIICNNIKKCIFVHFGMRESLTLYTILLKKVLTWALHFVPILEIKIIYILKISTKCDIQSVWD